MTVGEAHEVMLGLRDGLARGSREREALAVMSNAVDEAEAALRTSRALSALAQRERDEARAQVTALLALIGREGEMVREWGQRHDEALSLLRECRPYLKAWRDELEGAERPTKKLEAILASLDEVLR